MPFQPLLKRALPYLALLAGVLALSVSFLFVRLAQAPGLVTAFYRMGVASLVMLPLFLRSRHQKRLPRRAGWFLIALLGGVFIAGDHGTMNTAYQVGNIATTTLLNNLAPLWVALFAWLVLKQRLRTAFWMGLALALGGAGGILGGSFVTGQFSAGEVLGFISGFFYAAYYLVTERARKSMGTLAYIWVAVAGAAALLLAANLVLGNRLTGYPPATILAFLGAGVISQVCGYFSIGYALGHLPAYVVAPAMIAQPVLTSLLAVVLLKEPLSVAQVWGGLAVLAGIYLVLAASRPSVHDNGLST